MKRTLIVSSIPLILAACTPTPSRYTMELSINDPKWETESCREIRLAALNYDDKVGERVAIGLASGLLLGPFGIPIAAAADMEREDARKMFAREMHLRCSSLPLPEKLKNVPKRSPQTKIDKIR